MEQPQGPRFRRRAACRDGDLIGVVLLAGIVWGLGLAHVGCTPPLWPPDVVSRTVTAIPVAVFAVAVGLVGLVGCLGGLCR